MCEVKGMENYVLEIPENFTVDEVAKFRVEVKERIDKGTVNYIFDFARCEFIDSTGLGALVSVYKRCAEHNGSIKLRNLKEEVRKLFELTRLDKVFEIF